MIGRETQHQDLAVLMRPAQLQRLVQRRHAEIAQAVFHHVPHHHHSAVAVSVGLDDGHGLHIGAQLLPKHADVIFQVVQIDLRTGGPQMFHKSFAPLFQYLTAVSYSFFGVSGRGNAKNFESS